MPEVQAEIASVLASIGAAIRGHRKRRGLKLHEMQHRTQLSLGYLSQVELGKNSPSIETLFRIASAFGLTLAQLIASVDWLERSPLDATGE